MRRRLTVAFLVVLVLALLAAAVLVATNWWRDRGQTDLERAISYAPADAERLSWTDWAGVRESLGTDDLERLLDAGFDADLTSTSALVASGIEMEDRLSFSPASADWELFSQSEQGAVVILRMPEDTDFDALADRLERSGFARPDGDATAGGVWEGGEQLLAQLGGILTPELQHVALVADEQLVLSSDQPAYLAQAVDGLGDGPGDDEVADGLRDAVGAVGEPLSAAVYDGPYTCAALAMNNADPADQAAGERLVAEAGEVSPLTGFAMGVLPGGDVRVAMAFEDDERARTNADTRSVLASGPAPGQGGDFADRFALDAATADGNIVTLDLEPAEGSYVLSDLSTGPVLFATC
ncbi:MAG: hypothetical protein WBP61_15605 [Nocardioides sp.]